MLQEIMKLRDFTSCIGIKTFIYIRRHQLPALIFLYVCQK